MMDHNAVVDDDVDLTFSASMDEASIHDRNITQDWKTAIKSWFTVKRVIKFILFFLYFVVGCVFYHHYEGWSPYKTISFSIVTMCTVGELLRFELIQ